MRTTFFDNIFYPQSIAVIGFDSKADGQWSNLVRNLIQGGFGGKVYPINPHREMIEQLAVQASLLDLPHPVDLVIFVHAFPPDPPFIEECKRAAVKGVIIITSAGKNQRADSLGLKRAVEDDSTFSFPRIIGPESYGVFCSRAKMNASLAGQTPLSGRMAFIGQSSAICSSFQEVSMRACIGFSFLVSLGAMHDLDFGDLIDYVGEDFDVSSVVLCIEHLKRMRNFMSAARSVSRVKPIIALKIGRSAEGPKTRKDWTVTDIEKDAVYDAAFQRAGIVRVKTFEELLDCSELLAKQPRPTGPGLAIVTNSGVMGSMALDALATYNHRQTGLNSDTIRKLDEIFACPWNQANPVIVPKDLSPQDYGRVVDTCLDDADVRTLLIVLTPQLMEDPQNMVLFLSTHLKRKSYPVLTTWMGGPNAEKQREVFNRAGLTIYDTPERAVRAFINLYRYAQNIKMLQEIPAKLTARLVFDRSNARILIEKGLKTTPTCLTDGEAKDLLAAYGIPVTPLIEGCDYELALGAQTDCDFGPVIFFGVGGDMAEVIQDRAVGLPPLNRLLARSLMEQTKIFQCLQGAAGRQSADTALLEEILIRVSQLVTDFPEIERLEINPLAVTGNRACAVRARIALKPSQVAAPLHLVISPYPNEYETRTDHKEGKGLYIRPIRPEDAPLMVELFSSLSPHSIYLRFFSHLRQLPHKMLARLTQIDYDREIALVAIDDSNSREKMLGTARCIIGMNRKEAEFSIIVGDPWQGKGIGAELLKRCLRIAKARGIEKVMGLVLAENTQMLALGRKLKFVVKRIPGESDYELTIDLKKDLDF